MSWPRHILDRIVRELIEDLTPIITPKQQTVINQLNQILNTSMFKNNFQTQQRINFLMVDNGKER